MKPNGAVALLSDWSFFNRKSQLKSEWQREVTTVVQDFLPDTPAEEGKPYRLWTDVLRMSPFSDVIPEALFPVRRVWCCDTILGYLYSTSFAPRRKFGNRIGSFEDELRRRLARFSNTDEFIEENEWSVTVGRLRGK